MAVCLAHTRVFRLTRCQNTSRRGYNNTERVLIFITSSRSQDPTDRAIMKGEAPFEFRLREAEQNEAELKSQCSPEWRRIVYGSR